MKIFPLLAFCSANGNISVFFIDNDFNFDGQSDNLIQMEITF